MSTMGQIIRKLRKEHGFTQEALAERIGVTYQAVSKWENDMGMPDISQIVPLASVFDVSTDVLFGLDQTTQSEEAFKIISDADSVKSYGERETYLKAYDILMDGLKKHSRNLILMNHCLNLGVALVMPENGWLYAKDRADKIILNSIWQANFIISNSKNTTDVLKARQNLIFLYSRNQKFDLAEEEAKHFPVRTDFTLYSNLARVSEYMENYERTTRYLCSDIDYSLQTFEDNIARLGMAYYNNGKYSEAIEVYETFFAIIKTIFKDECPHPYHDFDSGDCYLLLAKAYLALNNESRAMDAVEKSVGYYLKLIETSMPSETILIETTSPLISKSELRHCIRKDVIKKKLLDKLNDTDLQRLFENSSFSDLMSRVNNL